MLIKRISKNDVKDLIPYHYLVEQSKGFRSGYNYGTYANNQLQIACVFHSPSVPETVKGCFGFKRNEQKEVFELGRLIKNPKSDSNIILSQFVALAIKQLRKDTNVKALITYADSRYHFGYIYQALNFKYYGLTSKKSDFWFEQEDGSYVKHTRGKIVGKKGEWRTRPQKHRYLMIYDRNLKTKWNEERYPKGKNIEFKKDT